MNDNISEEGKVIFPPVYAPKEYTPWRRFLAWVGFITILLAFPAIVTFVVWANYFLKANGL